MVYAIDHHGHPQKAPLVGRQREQAILLERLADAFEGRGGTVLVGGEAGIGKTTLVRDLAELAAGKGVLVLAGGSYDLTIPAPYGPWIEIVAQYRVADGLPTLPALLGKTLTGGDLGGPFALFETFQSFFADVSAICPLLLVLEDVHWADPASVDLLRSLARSLGSARTLIVATYRADEFGPDDSLTRILPAIVREAALERIDLRAIDELDTRQLVAARYALEPADERRLVDFLGLRAEGNPFFLGELLRTLEETRILARDEQHWRLGDLRHVPTPPLVRQLVEGRLTRLPEQARSLLTLASCIGQEVPLELWQQVSGADDAELDACIEQAMISGLTLESDDGLGLRFAHALVREALYGSAGLARRRHWHALAGEALARRAGADPSAVAHHFQQAGDPRAVEWLLEAGKRAQRAYVWKSAAECFESALEMLESRGAEPSMRGWLLFRIAKMRSHSDPATSIGALTRAIELGEEAGDRLLVALARFDRGHFRCYIPPISRGVTEIQEAAMLIDALVATDRERLVRLEDDGGVYDINDRRGTCALMLAAAGMNAEAIDWARRTLDAHPDAALSTAGRFRVTDAEGALALASAMEGWPDEAREYYAANRSVNQAQNRPDQVAVMALEELVVAILPFAADRIDERRMDLAEAGEAWSQMKLVYPDADPRFAILPLLVLRGDWDEARLLGLRWRDGNVFVWPFSAAFALGPLARDQGDFELAWSIVHDLAPEGPDGTPGESIFALTLALQRLAASLALDIGDLVDARRWLEAHDRWIDWSGGILWKAEGYLLWARLHRHTGDRTRAHELAQSALLEATEPRQPLAMLAAHRMLGELNIASGRFDSAEHHLQESLRLADLCRAVFERALTLLSLAELRVVSGKAGEARLLGQEVRSICEVLGAAPTLAKVDALLAGPAGKAPSVKYPAGLTAREVDVLRLVATGMTDVEIAEQLFIARRTVNTHLTSIYTKLGVTSRSAATRAAIEHGIT